MGGGMALLFAEDGVHVNLSDPSEEAMDAVIEKAEKAGYHGKLTKHNGMLVDTSLHLLYADVLARLRLTLQIALRTAPPSFLSTPRRCR
jgi:3-hydroxyacyl-CoA dehydrogenase